MLNVLHVITGLDTGGAESMLWRLIEGSDASRFRHSVVSLTTIGATGEAIRRNGVEVSALGMQGILAPTKLLALRRIIRRERPDVVKSWMYHGDFAATVATAFLPHVPVVWGVHNANLAPNYVRGTTIRIARMCAWLSHRSPARIVCDSHAAVGVHTSLGYDAARFTVIPNGFDTDVFRPIEGARERVRSRLGLSATTPLIGLVARYDPLKDHANFVAAAALVRRSHPKAHFVLCGGRGIDESNAELASLIDAHALRDSVHLLGRVDDIPELLSALDVGVSSSRSESLPLAVGELMACGIACVVTDVGDSRALVGETGITVRAENAAALAEGIVGTLAIPEVEQAARSAAARQRIIEHFSLRSVVKAYETLLETVVLESGRGAAAG